MAKYGGRIKYTVEKIYKDGDTITVGGTTLQVIHSPGHTDGSTVLYDAKSKSLFAGDVVFQGGACGRVDFPTGDRQVMIKTLQMLSELDIEHLYSGHGPDLHTNVRRNIIQAKKMMEYW